MGKVEPPDMEVLWARVGQSRVAHAFLVRDEDVAAKSLCKRSKRGNGTYSSLRPRRHCALCEVEVVRMVARGRPA